MSERNHSKTNNDGPEHDYLSIKEILVSTFSLVISALWFSCKNYVSVLKNFKFRAYCVVRMFVRTLEAWEVFAHREVEL